MVLRRDEVRDSCQVKNLDNSIQTVRMIVILITVW